MIKLLKLELETLCYSLGSILFAFIFVPTALTDINIISFFFPTTSGQYWFMSAYMLLYIFSPFINFFLNNAPQKMIELCLTLLLVIYIVIPTFTSYTIAGNSTITIFVTLYMLGGYIKLYPNRLTFFSKHLQNLFISGICYLFIFVSIIFFNHVPIRHYTYFMSLNSLPLVLCSFCLFLATKNTPTFYNHYVNKIASSVLGVYLIHDNPIIRTLLWQQWLHNYTYCNSSFLIIRTLITVCVVFIACIAIDKVRILIIEKPFLNFFNNFLNILYYNITM